MVLRKYHDIIVEWEGKKFSGINIEWDYTNRTFRLTMDYYIKKLCVKYNYPNPKKPQLSPHKHHKINYVAKTQYTSNANDSTKIYNKGIKRVQIIVGAMLYYSIAFNAKLLVSLCGIGSQQAVAMENTNEAIEELLGCVAAYPNNGITYLSRNMILDRHSDAAYLNVSKACS